MTSVDHLFLRGEIQTGRKNGGKYWPSLGEAVAASESVRCRPE